VQQVHDQVGPYNDLNLGLVGGSLRGQDFPAGRHRRRGAVQGMRVLAGVAGDLIKPQKKKELKPKKSVELRSL
jgi:hypothetical protein